MAGVNGPQTSINTVNDSSIDVPVGADEDDFILNFVQIDTQQGPMR